MTSFLPMVLTSFGGVGEVEGSGLDLSSEGCRLQDGASVACLPIRYCLHYTGKNVPPAVGELGRIGKGAHTPRAVEQAGRQASWQASSVSHTLWAVNSISTCLFPIESGCVVVVRAHWRNHGFGRVNVFFW